MLNKRYCKNCGKEFKTKKRNKIFCCHDCQCKWESDKVKKRWFYIFQRDNFTCVYCGRNVFEDKIKLQVDHLIPRAKGGTDEKNNLVTSCSDCNLSKGNKLLSKEIIEKINMKNIYTDERGCENGEAL